MKAVFMGGRMRNHLLPTFFFLLTLFSTVAFADHDASEPPKQVVVSVKIIEFQVTKGVETGLSAYFLRTAKALPFGQVSALNMADLTFPTSSAAGITVFLDRIGIQEGQFEFILQALVDENRAFILSKPRAMVMVGETTPTIVQTTQQIPYENTVVVGSTAVQVTAFEDTGIVLVPSGQALVIGGLSSRVIVNSERRVPILGKIPILGIPFRSRQSDIRTTHLMIFVAPTVVDLRKMTPGAVDALTFWRQGTWDNEGLINEEIDVLENEL